MFRSIIVSLLFLGVGTNLCHAQLENPVKWAFGVQQKDEKTYLVVAKATMPAGWHIYAQQQPEDAISTPTSFVFAPNPAVTLVGKVKEQGKLVYTTDPEIGISSNEYHGEVVFYQEVKLKTVPQGGNKVKLNGTVEFMACTGERCLPPEEVEFVVEF